MGVHDFDVGRACRVWGRSKQIRHCMLMRMLNWPFLSPFSDSRWLLGSARNSSRATAASRISSRVGGELVNFSVNRPYGAVSCRLAGVIICNSCAICSSWRSICSLPSRNSSTGRRAPGRSWSVRTMARSGLRMMPTFPPSPLSVGSRSGAVSLRFRLPGAPRFLWEWTH